jgi:hypothetical protein
VNQSLNLFSTPPKQKSANQNKKLTMKFSRSTLLVLLSFAVSKAGAEVVSLTSENFESLTEGKNVFIKV